MTTQTPMMAQWEVCKKSAPDTLLLFRLGDFYEAFYEDAHLLSAALDLTLTKRGDIPMAGIPHHMGESYIDKLVAKGYRVALAEQMEEPQEGKSLVERKVVRVITPGTLISSSLIEDKEPNYVACLCHFNQIFGLALLDITTAHFFAMEFEKKDELLETLLRISPKEILLPQKWRGKSGPFLNELTLLLSPTYSYIEGWHFEHKSCLELLCRHFQIHSLDSFGLSGMQEATSAAGALLSYVQEELHLPTRHLTTLCSGMHGAGYEKNAGKGYMRLDQNTKQHLELVFNTKTTRKESTLLYLLDETKTAMGGRLLRHFVLHPLFDKEEICKRQEEIKGFIAEFHTLLELRKCLGEIKDLERLIMRIETGFAAPRDLIALRTSLEEIPKINMLIERSLFQGADLASEIKRALVDIPPAKWNRGKSEMLFKKGFHLELDALFAIKEESDIWIENYQQELRNTLGIKTLKVGYTKAFGYYLEVSKGQSQKIPFAFHRRQTLVNTERFLSPELKEFEHKILSADAKIAALEEELFSLLCTKVAASAKEIRTLAADIAHLDCIASLAKIALERRYVCPQIVDGLCFDLIQGRHPILEAQMNQDFIPNDIFLDPPSQQLVLLTGPNMAGKSTFIRQVALLAIMAQIGSFVPATHLKMGLIDSVFTRIGASDDLSRGQSTFMVEMSETAKILHLATPRSLLILDEIGRGTSTYDGISIAWAVAQYLLTNPEKKAKTLFATHYFELTELADFYPSARNFTVAIEEESDGIVFLRKIIPGAADKSYGIHVAKLAGLPSSVLVQAEAKLASLEKAHQEITREPRSSHKGAPSIKKPIQQDLFSSPSVQVSALLEKLKSIDLNQLSPLDALTLLFKWKTDAL